MFYFFSTSFLLFLEPNNNLIAKDFRFKKLTHTHTHTRIYNYSKHINIVDTVAYKNKKHTTQTMSSKSFISAEKGFSDWLACRALPPLLSATSVSCVVIVQFDLWHFLLLYTSLCTNISVWHFTNSEDCG